MSAAEDCRNWIIAIRCIDHHQITATGICAATADRMMRDPLMTFQTMTTGERERFWPLVERYLDLQRKRTREWMVM